MNLVKRIYIFVTSLSHDLSIPPLLGIGCPFCVMLV